MFTTFTVKNHQINSAHIIHIPRCLTFTIHLCYTTNMICVNNDMCDIYKICFTTFQYFLTFTIQLPWSLRFLDAAEVTPLLRHLGISGSQVTPDVTSPTKEWCDHRGIIMGWSYYMCIYIYTFIYIYVLYIYICFYIYIFIYVTGYISSWPHVADRALESWFFIRENHPQMAELFRLVKYYNLPRWDYDPWNCLGVSDMVRYGLLCTFQFRDSDSKQSQKKFMIAKIIQFIRL